MAEKIRELLREYQQGKISRRDFMRQAIIATGSLAAATRLLESLLPPIAYGAQVEPSDPALVSTDVQYGSTDGTSVGAYVTRPKADGRRPAIIVVHDNGALDEHNRDVARKLAKAGYAAIVPDLLSRQGGNASFPNREAIAKAISSLDNEAIIKDLTGAVNYLNGQSFVQPKKIGVVGFCWGGGKTLLFTTRSKDVAASVVYYGPMLANFDDVKNITAPVLAHYGELDKPITSQVPKLEEAMEKYGKSFEYKIFNDAPHAFNSDNRPDRYRPEAAKEAWSRTLEFFDKHLKS